MPALSSRDSLGNHHIQPRAEPLLQQMLHGWMWEVWTVGCVILSKGFGVEEEIAP